MTPEERRRRTEALLRAQGKSEAQIAVHLAQQAASPPHAMSTASHRADRRADADVTASAPYRLVPFDKDSIVRAQDAAAPDPGPRPDGLCANIEVTWTAEGPLLIGSEDKVSGEVVPITLGGAQNWIIPGSTLRGAVRAVSEIAGGGRLSQVNRDRVFPLRDFTHRDYGTGRYPVSDPTKVMAGWLMLRGHALPGAKQRRHPVADAALNGAFAIESCPAWYAVTAADIGTMRTYDSNRLPADRRPRDPSGFTRLRADEKYLSTGGFAHGVISPAIATHRFRSAPVLRSGMKIVAPDAAGGIEGCLVFSGASPGGKVWEYVLPPPGRGPATLIEPATMKRFRELNSRAVDDALEPDGTWALVMDAFRRNPEVRIPVFFVGKLEAQDRDFCFGLTRLFRVPHLNDLDTVLNNSGVHRLPVGANEPRDMVDALFGYVIEPLNGERAAPRDVARKGRVAFRHASLQGDAHLTAPIATVLMGPKPSFAPFYLAPDHTDAGARDYSSKTPRIAGVKRYPPRFDAAPAAPRDALSAVQAKLARQIAHVTEMQRGRAPRPDVLTRLRFLMPPPDGAPLRFTSTIRLWDVTAEELGLVLWALTFGGRQATHRHMLGHAKPMGAGQVRVEIARLHVEANRPDPAVDTADAKHFIDAFLAISAAAEPARRLLLAAADPGNGARWARDDKLDTMIVARRVGGRLVQYFQRLRDLVKVRRAGDPLPADVDFLPLS